MIVKKASKKNYKHYHILILHPVPGQKRIQGGKYTFLKTHNFNILNFLFCITKHLIARH